MTYTVSMLDIAYIRENTEVVKKACTDKGARVDIDRLLELDDQRRVLLTEIENLRQERNKLAQKAKSAKGGKPSQKDIDRGREIKEKLQKTETEYEKVASKWRGLLLAVPNVPLPSVPVGSSEDDNVVTKEWGDRPEFDFNPKNHWQLGEDLDLIDKERAAKVAGSRFAYIKGGLAELQFALIQLAIQVTTDTELLKKLIMDNDLDLDPKPFVPILPPALVRTKPYEATARLNAEEVTYKLADDDLWLNASAEHSLCNMYMDEILDEAELPIRYIGYATSFRREAGTYGKDTEGIVRMHQFNKVEMEVFSTRETGEQEHRLLVAIQEHLMQCLGLPYRVLNKCTADIGGPNASGIDIDSWLPGQGRYIETHTADYMTDYQARRLNTRYKKPDGTIELVHTNDATVFSQRPMIAIMENYQQADGSIRVPDILKPFMREDTL